VQPVLLQQRDENTVELFDVVVEDAHRWPAIPDDVYRVRYTRHDCSRVASFNQQAKLFLRARIIDPGPYYGIELFRSYRVTMVGAGKTARFKVRRNSDLLKMVCKVLDVKARPDRISLRSFKSLVLTARTRTVKKDYKQHDLHPSLWYSVIDEILGVEAGAPQT
jgi:hypothetical protein